MTGIPRSTIGYWKHASNRRTRFAGTLPPADDRSYSYLLGLYLGDGHIVVRSPRNAWFRLTLDLGYPAIAAEAAAALRRLFPNTAVRRYDRRASGTIVLQVSSGLLPAVFPQHGPGPKHARKIELHEWQQAITRRHPGAFLRGLIHSDGCRTVNRFKTKLPSGRIAEYEYVRYFFSNLSADIRGMFCEHCDLLGIEWTQSNHRNISVSRRASVGVLGRVVGPKR